MAMIQITEGHTGRINSIIATPDNKFMLSGSDDNTIRLWQINNGACRHIFQGHTNPVNSVAVMSDSRSFVSGSKDCTLKLWDLQKGDCLGTFGGHSDSVNTVAISSDGTFIVSGSSDHDLRKWDVRTGECLQVFERHPADRDRDGLNRLIRSSNAEFAYHDFIGHLGIASTYSQNGFAFFGHADPVTAVALSPDDRFVLSGSEDNTLRLWQSETGECLWLFGGRHGGTHFSISAVAITPNGKSVISASETLQSWRLTSRKLCRLFWGVMNEKPRRTFKQIEGVPEDIAVAPNGKHIAVIENGDRRIGIYKIRTGKRIRSIELSSGRASSITISPDGRLLIAGFDGGALHSWELP